MDFLRNALSSSNALLVFAAALLGVAAVLFLSGFSIPLAVLAAFAGSVFLLVWFMHSRIGR